MPRFLILGIAVVVVLTIYAVIDCAMSEARRIRVLSKPVWLVAILLLPIVGPICWILFGKGLIQLTSGRRGAPASDAAAGRPRAGAAAAYPASPDDDPEFLRRLREETAAERRRLERERQQPGDPKPPEAEARPGERGQDGIDPPADGEDDADGQRPADG